MRLIRLKEVMNLTGLGRSTIYKIINEGDFPKQVPLGGRMAAWVESEIEEWLQDKIDCRDTATDYSIKKTSHVTEKDVIIFIKEKFKRLTIADAMEWVLKVTKETQLK